MVYFIAFIQSLFTAIGGVITQKVLLRRSIGNNWQTILSRCTHLVLLLVLLASGVFEFAFEPIQADPWYYGGMFLLGFSLIYVTYPLRRIALLNEKISTLQPFSLMRQVFSVVCAIVLLGEHISLITLVLTFVAVGILIASNIENRKIVVNKYSMMILLSSFIQAIGTIIVVKMTLHLGSFAYYLYESIGILMIAFILVFSQKETQEIRAITRSYFWLQVTASIVAFIAIIATFSLYGKLWVAVSSLFSLLYLVFALILGVIFLADIPSKKTIISTTLIAFCIAGGVMFRHVS